MEEISSELKDLLDKYFIYATQDEKPVKGERKMADEQMLLIADIIDQYTNDTPENLKILDFFKICVLE